VTVAIALVAAITLLATLMAAQVYKARKNAVEQRSLMLAAEGELARLRAGLPATSRSATPAGAGLESGSISVDVHSTPGTGRWEGFALVRVVAQRMVGGSSRRVELRAYLPLKSTAELLPRAEAQP
jgi:hypothetical protein